MKGRPILTAAEMRAAEASVIGSGTGVDVLMERAGEAIAQITRRYAGGADALVLCGPGNNGGDGYVAARVLAAAGIAVRVAASGPPSTEAAMRARAAWTGAIEEPADAEPATVLIDALFGTGLKRRLQDVDHLQLNRLRRDANIGIAVDLPSGAASDDGTLLSPVPAFDLTVALAALKPAHLLQPAAATMGRLVVADIGAPVSSRLFELPQPRLAAPGPRDHKYTRGLVTVLAGAMPGAARLAALGAARAGAGYVQLLGSVAGGELPAAIVMRSGVDSDALADTRIGALVAGPGLGRDAEGAKILELAVSSGRPLILDADALWHLGDCRLECPAIFTPHEAEFARAYGNLSGDKVTQTRHAARISGAVVVLKGADTVVAAPDGRAAIAPLAPPDLATAGTGDVLAGVCGTMLAQLGDSFEAACAAVWLHAEAARAVAGPFVADDLAAALPLQVARCR